MVALLVLGSAILLYSCVELEVNKANKETLMTQYSDTLTIIQTEEGRCDYIFNTPLMERYEFAKEPYMEFRRGIEVTSYNDSTGAMSSFLRADYAIFFEKRQLWETKGNVVARSSDEQTIYTQQLFWNQKTHKIYSNVDSKVVKGQDVFIGEGFESDEQFEKWSFRNFTGKLLVDTEVTEQPDSTADDQK